jgi:hypothetical protein
MEKKNRSGTYVGKQIMTRNNKEQGKIVPVHTMKAFGIGGINHSFLISALEGVSGQLYAPAG